MAGTDCAPSRTSISRTLRSAWVVAIALDAFAFRACHSALMSLAMEAEPWSSEVDT